MSRLSRFLFATSVIVALQSYCSVALHAQRIDNRGTEFIIAFMPTNGFDDRPRLAVGVSASQPTTGTLTYKRRQGTQAISIPVADQVVWIDLDVAMLYANDISIGDMVTDYTVELSFRAPVTIIGANTMQWSGDVFLALPTHVLGREYVVLASPSSIKPSFPTTDADFPSQFNIVATEDGTVVHIVPSTLLYRGGRASSAEFSIALNRGQTYLAQSHYSQGAGRDVSGTVISANRPVAVSAGAMRANIPWTQAMGRDHLVEQMIPTELWRTDAIVTPFYQIGKTRRDSNIFRVVSSNQAQTAVMVDGQLTATLKPHEVIELPLQRGAHVTANGPILVAQYHPSADTLIRLENDSIGDPTMILAASPEQFDTAFVVQSLASDIYRRHFINIVVRDGTQDQLRLDGSMPVEVFNAIGTSEYSYAQIEVNPGSHHLRSSTPFGVVAYGYGGLTAYGYPGGLVLKRPPAREPYETGIAGDVVVSPNPVIGEAVTLTLELDEPGPLSVEILDPIGASVGTSVVRSWLLPGRHSFEIDVSALSAGVYALDLTAAGRRLLRRLVIVR